MDVFEVRVEVVEYSVGCVYVMVCCEDEEL